MIVFFISRYPSMESMLRDRQVRNPAWRHAVYKLLTNEVHSLCDAGTTLLCQSWRDLFTEQRT